MEFIVRRGEVGLRGCDLPVAHNRHHSLHRDLPVVETMADEGVPEGVQYTTIQTHSLAIRFERP